MQAKPSVGLSPRPGRGHHGCRAHGEHFYTLVLVKNTLYLIICCFATLLSKKE